MSNSTKFEIVGIRNNIALLKRVGTGFYALAEDAQYVGEIGQTVEVLEKDYVTEGDLAAYQALYDNYNK